MWGNEPHCTPLPGPYPTEPSTSAAVKLEQGGTTGELPATTNPSPSTTPQMRLGRLGQTHGLYDSATLMAPYAERRLTPKTCHLFRREKSFLCNDVSAAEVSTVPQLGQFPATSSYYRRLAKELATIASPLQLLTQKGQSFQWGEDCADSTQLRSALVAAPILAYPDSN